MNCDTLTTECKNFNVAADEAITDVRKSIHRASWRQIGIALVGSALTIFGAAAMIISVNFFIASFPKQDAAGYPVGGPYTVLLLSGLFSLLLYIVAAVYWLVRYRPVLSPLLRNSKPWLFSGAAGVSWMVNGLLTLTSAPFTPVSLQAVLVSSGVLFTLLFTQLFGVNQGRSFCHVLVFTSVALTVGGIVLATFATESGDSPANTSNRGVWAFLYALGIVPAALVNVIAAKYMQTCSYDEEEIKKRKEGLRQEIEHPSHHHHHHHHDSVPRSSAASRASAVAAAVHHAEMSAEARPLIDQIADELCPDHTRDEELLEASFAELFFLLFGTAVQVVATVIALPTDFAPWFGPNAGNSTASTHALANGFACVFNTLDAAPNMNSCGDSSLSFTIFVLAFTATTTGMVMLAAYSAPMAAFVPRIATPITAVLVVAFPSWAPSESPTNVAQAIVGALLLIAGAFIFLFWELMTTERKVEEEEQIVAEVVGAELEDRQSLAPAAALTQNDAPADAPADAQSISACDERRHEQRHQHQDQQQQHDYSEDDGADLPDRD